MDFSQTESIEKIDQSYVPFIDFSNWKPLRVDTVRWRSALDELENEGSKDPVVLKRAREAAKTAAAIDLLPVD